MPLCSDLLLTNICLNLLHSQGGQFPVAFFLYIVEGKVMACFPTGNPPLSECGPSDSISILLYLCGSRCFCFVCQIGTFFSKTPSLIGRYISGHLRSFKGLYIIKSKESQDCSCREKPTYLLALALAAFNFRASRSSVLLFHL